jgi:hypothetical protein
MSRPTHATTPSGDEVTLEANAQVGVQPRSVAQVEHNAMQALDLVRAALTALNNVTRLLERASLLLAHGRGSVAAAVVAELERVHEQLGMTIGTAELYATPLLRGGGAAFALQGPRDELSEPIWVALPDLHEPYLALLAEPLRAGEGSGRLSQRYAELTSRALAARAELTANTKLLCEVLRNQRQRVAKTAVPRRADDERFVSLIQQVRTSVLHAGHAALRVQGNPTSRAAWLVEAIELAR